MPPLPPDPPLPPGPPDPPKPKKGLPIVGVVCDVVDDVVVVGAGVDSLTVVGIVGMPLKGKQVHQ